jgi:ATP-binding cassette subfamily B protein
VKPTRGIPSALALAWSAAPLPLAATAAVTVVEAGIPVATVWLGRTIINAVVSGAPTSTLVARITALATVGLIAATTPQAARYLRAASERAIGYRAVEHLHLRMEGMLGLARFEDPEFLDRLTLAKGIGGDACGNLVFGALAVARAVLTITGLLGAVSVLGPAVAGAVLVSGLPAFAGEYLISRRRANMYWRISPTQRRELFYSSLLSDVAAAKEIRAFGIGGFLRQKMLTERRAADGARRRMDREELLAQLGLGVLSAGVAGAAVIWSVVTARARGLTAGDISMLIGAVPGFQSAIATVALQLGLANQSRLLFHHYLSVIAENDDIIECTEPRPLPPLRNGIELRNVWFRYSEHHPWILRGVSLSIPAGRAVGLVGLNGEGKSTIIKLLCRFYDPTQGSILWDGIDLRNARTAELRSRIGTVFQDAVRYDLSVAENIGLGDLALADDRALIQAAASRAGADEFITKLPAGYDTLLSRTFAGGHDGQTADHGIDLSGGQWQRLALARAFLRGRRELMILDEAVSGLDAAAEYDVNANIKTQRAQLTSVIVSHRLGTIRDADLIAYLDNGAIVEQGTHDELIRLEGRYAELFALQASGYQLDSAGTGSGTA